jgi:hypothetical protein
MEGRTFLVARFSGTFGMDMHLVGLCILFLMEEEEEGKRGIKNQASSSFF